MLGSRDALLKLRLGGRGLEAKLSVYICIYIYIYIYVCIFFSEA